MIATSASNRSALHRCCAFSGALLVTSALSSRAAPAAEPVSSGAALAAEPRGAGAAPSGLAPAATPQLRGALADDYCEYLRETAASESALLWSPQVFSRFGTLHASSNSPVDAQNVVSGDRTLLNLQAGLEISPTRMREGALVEARARAECRRYGAELAIEDLRARLAPDDSAALAARAAALRSSVASAQAVLQKAKQDLSQARINLPRYAAIRGRVADLQRALDDAEFELAAAPPAQGSPAQGSPAQEARPRQALSGLVQAEADVQAIEGRLRRLDAIDVNLRAGYERIFGLDQSLPLFGAVTVRFAPGSFWQSASEQQGASARRRWVEDRVRQLREQVGGASQRMAQQLAISRRQEARLSGDVSELRARYTELGQVNTPAAQEFRLDLWFELARLEADLAFARARSESLTRRQAQLAQALAP